MAKMSKDKHDTDTIGGLRGDDEVTFRVARGGIDPRTQSASRDGVRFTLKVIAASSERLKLENDDGTQFTLTAEQWEKLYRPAIYVWHWPNPGADRFAEEQTAAAPNTREHRVHGPRIGPPANVMLPAGQIVIPPDANPRQSFPQDGLLDLGRSMQEVGQLQPIVVNLVDGQYVLVAGERRLRSLLSPQGGATVLVDCKVYADLPPERLWQMRHAENRQRQALNPIEDARDYQHGLDAGFNVRQIAEADGASLDYVQRRLNLLKLPEGVQGLVACGKLPVHQANELLKGGLTDEQRIELAESAVKGRWSEEGVRSAVEELLDTGQPLLEPPAMQPPAMQPPASAGGSSERPKDPALTGGASEHPRRKGRMETAKAKAAQKTLEKRQRAKRVQEGGTTGSFFRVKDRIEPVEIDFVLRGMISAPAKGEPILTGLLYVVHEGHWQRLPGVVIAAPSLALDLSAAFRRAVAMLARTRRKTVSPKPAKAAKRKARR